MKYRVMKWDRSERPNAAELQTAMIADGYRVFEWSDPPGAVYGRHEHADDQSHWIISGALELMVDGFGIVVLDAGDRDYMPARTLHSAKVVGDESVHYLIGSKEAGQRSVLTK